MAAMRCGSTFGSGGRGEHALDEMHEAAVFEARFLKHLVVRELAAAPDQALPGRHHVDLALHLLLEVLHSLLQPSTAALMSNV